MIVVRDIFRVRFGKAKETTDLWKQGVAILKKVGYGRDVRMMTDLAGPPYYTLVLESTYDSLAEWERLGQSIRGNAEWRTWYQQVAALTEDGRREIYSIVA